VVNRHRGRRDEADRRTHDRRYDLVGSARADHDTGDIRIDEEEGFEKGTTEVQRDETLKTKEK
jgi:hypothetical protein